MNLVKWSVTSLEENKLHSGNPEGERTTDSFLLCWLKNILIHVSLSALLGLSE